MLIGRSEKNKIRQNRLGSPANDGRVRAYTTGWLITYVVSSSTNEEIPFVFRGFASSTSQNSRILHDHLEHAPPGVASGISMGRCGFMVVCSAASGGGAMCRRVTGRQSPPASGAGMA